MIDYLNLESFLDDEELTKVKQNNEKAVKKVWTNTEKVNKIYDFIVKNEWDKQLDGNKRLARNILDSIKLFEKPQLTNL